MNFLSSYDYVACANVGLAVFIVAISIGIDIAISCISGNVAAKKGRSYGAWFCLTFFLLGIIGLIIIICLPDLNYYPNNYNNGYYGGQMGNNGQQWMCKRCGHGNIGGAYCKVCGAERPSGSAYKTWKCPHCGQENPDNAIYCRGCGRPKNI